MPTSTTQRKPTRRRAKPATNSSRTEAALDRLNASLEAAQDAAKAIGGDIARGRRDMARDVERVIAATRKDATRLSKAVRKDIADFEKTVKRPTSRPRAQQRSRTQRKPQARR